MLPCLDRRQTFARWTWRLRDHLGSDVIRVSSTNGEAPSSDRGLADACRQQKLPQFRGVVVFPATAACVLTCLGWVAPWCGTLWHDIATVVAAFEP